jgi:hypothetical protein
MSLLLSFSALHPDKMQSIWKYIFVRYVTQCNKNVYKETGCNQVGTDGSQAQDVDLSGFMLGAEVWDGFVARVLHKGWESVLANRERMRGDKSWMK